MAPVRSGQILYTKSLDAFLWLCYININQYYTFAKEGILLF